MEAIVFLTKYALSSGIEEVELTREYKVDNMKFVYVKGKCSSYKIGSEAFFSKEDAIKQAEIMRLKKIESLKKQIKKLEKLKFE